MGAATSVKNMGKTNIEGGKTRVHFAYLFCSIRLRGGTETIDFASPLLDFSQQGNGLRKAGHAM
jgi:hypothetical protein